MGSDLIRRGYFCRRASRRLGDAPPDARSLIHSCWPAVAKDYASSVRVAVWGESFR